VEVQGTAAHVVVLGGGKEIARHARGTEARLLLDPARVSQRTPLVEGFPGPCRMLVVPDAF
jgi:hypothetical protein